MNRVLSICAAMAVLAVAAGTATQQPPVPPPTAAEQRPLFRGGTHFVRVDAYPIQDGKIVEGLKAEDFEIFEDGKPTPPRPRRRAAIPRRSAKGSTWRRTRGIGCS